MEYPSLSYDSGSITVQYVDVGLRPVRLGPTFGFRFPKAAIAPLILFLGSNHRRGRSIRQGESIAIVRSALFETVPTLYPA